MYGSKNENTGNVSSDSGSQNTTSGALAFGDQLFLVLVRNETLPQTKGFVSSGRNLKKIDKSNFKLLKIG
jgi:hypothetical protein